MQESKESKIILQKTIAEIIKEYRLKEKKSISLISNEINLSKSIWSQVEKGVKDIQISTLWRICEALEIPLSAFILEIEKRTKGKINFLE